MTNQVNTMTPSANQAEQTKIIQPPPQLTIELTDCVESVGIGLVNAERAQHLLPPGFKLLNDGGPVTPLVVLGAQCQGIAVTGAVPSPGAYVQIGLVIAPPDNTGEINILMLWHFTTHLTLARGLKSLGLNSQHLPTLDYDVTLGGKAGSTRITVPAPAQPPLILGGKISEPTEPISFAGNWWAKTERGLLKMSSTVPHALASDAQLTLTTRADNPLGRLIGADTLSFAALQRFNIFKQAQTAVSLQQPVTSNSVQKRSNL